LNTLMNNIASYSELFSFFEKLLILTYETCLSIIVNTIKLYSELFSISGVKEGIMVRNQEEEQLPDVVQIA